jgi:sarcosine oxidase, subunit gamma
MADIAPRIPFAADATAWMRLLPPATRFVLHAERAARERLAGVFPIAAADEICRARVDGDRASLWLGPDEYLLIAPDREEPAALAATLRAALDTAPHALVDVSHRQVALEIHGPQAAKILNGACPLDLDDAVFPVGMCTRTGLAKADIVLWRLRADAFRVEVWRSFAAYATALLAEIARDVP